MGRMLPGIETVTQHQEQLRDDPDAYRPERCPHCGKGGLHHHGHYERNTPRVKAWPFRWVHCSYPDFIARSATGPARGCLPVWHRDVSIGGALSRRCWRG